MSAHLLYFKIKLAILKSGPYICNNKRGKVATQDGTKQKLKDMNTAEKVTLLNEYYQSVNYNDDIIYSFDEYTINELFTDPWEVMKSAVFGNVNMGHDYFHFDGSGNLETLPDWKIDKLFEDSDFQEWVDED